jgi:DNA replicative helicase MCM subunit Mcm2 (Cdc46/Mcm family)
MPAGQTPVTVTVVAHNDLVDAVQPGDRYVNCTFETDRNFSILVFK